jgi:hypothetical protein
VNSSSEIERCLFVPDTHCPYHDRRAWKLVMEVGKAFKPDVLLHIGDLADFYKVSSHSKDPTRGKSFKQEVEECKRLREEMDDLGARRKIFVEGNHEDRLRRQLAEKFPELYEFIDTDSLLKLTENDWEFYPYREHAKIGKVYFTHDVGGGGKFSTSRAIETFQHSVGIGHHHSIQFMVAGDATGKYQVGVQFGWLGDKSKIDYLSRAKVARLWAPGFGVGYHHVPTGIVHLVPVAIVGYTACVEGRLFRA